MSFSSECVFNFKLDINFKKEKIETSTILKEFKI